MKSHLFISFFTIIISITSDSNRVITTLRYSRNYVKPTILNGVPVKKGEVPYLVSIKESVQKFKKNHLWINLCGGSIIANDIAILFVDEAWNYTKYVDYVALARKKVDYSGDCYAFGFGSNAKFRKMSPVLYMAKINVLSKMQCNFLWEMNMDEFVCSNSAMTDVSDGDSGGPLSCRGTLDPAEKPGRDLLVGVVSGKNFDKTTLFTRVCTITGLAETVLYKNQSY
ncbi:hypothetical protein O3G_MSEX004322 [Manduca sexta]|uniref:Peptidase S1 domain-containing protein n=1 Tax=Manduca sexta TaxID=7130 RepID=A0A921YW59_MANSE|nr:hypothetical protein O3G_MSEX004322 [Manduca sexta]